MTELKFPFSNIYTEKYIEFIETCEFLRKSDVGENHHIFPKSIFGDNSVIVRLSYMNHFRAHWLLAKMYEKQGLKREYMKMAKAFFQFIGHASYRKEVIKDYSEEEILELSILIDAAKEQNRLSSIGELNPFYGKSHSPEKLKVMSDKRQASRDSWKCKHLESLNLYYTTRDSCNSPRHWYYHPEKLENTRISDKDIQDENIPDGFIPGYYVSPESSLKKSLAIREFYSTYTESHWASGDAHHWHNTKHIHSKELNSSKRIKSGDSLPDGYVYGYFMTPEHKQKLVDCAFKRRGVKAPWVANETNKNPEKIRKTADKHRGMERSSAAKENMSISRNKFFDNGGVTPTKGTKRYFNLKSRKFHYVKESEVHLFDFDENMYSGKLNKVFYHDGSFIYITKEEKLPYGYRYATNAQ